MHRNVILGLAPIAGVAAGIAGERILTNGPAHAQTAGFHAIAVSSTGSGNAALAWVVGQDGAVRLCSGNGGPPLQVACAPVRF